MKTFYIFKVVDTKFVFITTVIFAHLEPVEDADHLYDTKQRIMNNV